MNAYREMEVRSAKAESALAAIQKDFAIYREEKCENERIISEQVNDTSTSSMQVTALFSATINAIEPNIPVTF